MHIELSREQYRQLLVLVFLGEWMANGTLPEGSQHQELDALAKYIYRHATQFGAEDWIELCADCGEHHENLRMEEALFPLVDAYDEDTFWDSLAHHLAFRDVLPNAEPNSQLSVEAEMRLRHRKDQYNQEFRKHGLQHIRLVFEGGRKQK